MTIEQEGVAQAGMSQIAQAGGYSVESCWPRSPAGGRWPTAHPGLASEPLLLQVFREIRIIASRDEFPRNTSGKVQRQLVEQ